MSRSSLVRLLVLASAALGLAQNAGAALQVSIDGTCGIGVTCTGSSFGECCSEYGFCGSEASYCGAGCKPAFGTCGDGVSNPPTASVGLPVTKTVIFKTTVTETSTSIQIVSSTVTSIRVVESTRGNGHTVEVTRTVTTAGSCTSTQQPPPTPSPTLPNTPNNCKKFSKVERGDTCRDVAKRNGITQSELKDLNPSLDKALLDGLVCGLLGGPSCRINCDSLPTGYFLCVDA